MNLTATTIAPTPLPSNIGTLHGFWIFFFIYIFLAAIATVVLNGLTLFAIFKDPLKCFRNPLAIFITGVLIADFVTGLIGEASIAVGIAHGWSTGSHVGWAMLFYGLVVFLIAVSISFNTLLALGICQLLAIGWITRYESCVSPRSAKIGVAIIWVSNVIACAVFFILNFWLVVVFTLLEVAITTIALVIIYIVSYRVFRTRVQNILNEDVVTKEFFWGTFVLVLVQVITVWPYIATAIGIPLFLSGGHRSPEDWVNTEIVRVITNVLFLAKFFVDPIILVWRIRKYRQSLKIVYASFLCSGCKEDFQDQITYDETRRDDLDEPHVEVA